MWKRLAAAACAVLACAAAGPGAPALLRAQSWTAPGDALAHDLTHAPSECLARRTRETEIGRALFRSPALLGGPAERAGLSCDACHSNGGMNTRFLLPELSDAPGHADVTSEWASRVRGDGVRNPIPIPDLAGIARRESFGQAREPSLEVFVRGVIEEEFQGERPPPQAFEAVLAYVRALELRACPPGETRIDLASAADDVQRAIAAAEDAEPATARLLTLAAQDAMGRIAERLPRQRFARERARIEALSREVGAWRSAENLSAALTVAAPGWRARFAAAIAAIARREDETYFNQATLAAAL